jgi:hypothetical protein
MRKVHIFFKEGIDFQYLSGVVRNIQRMTASSFLLFPPLGREKEGNQEGIKRSPRQWSDCRETIDTGKL